MNTAMAEYMVWLSKQSGDHDHLWDACSSDIERLFLSGLIRGGIADRVELQQWVGRYRVDFVADGWLVIETDGFEWHYHRQEQVAADLRRTRYLMAHGFSVIRFLGTEVWNDLDECVDEVRAALAGPDRRLAS